MTGFVQYGSEKIMYNILFVDRKSLGITVYPNRNVEVKAPLNTTLDKIQKKVKKRASWILKQQDYFLSFEPRITNRKFVSGETHYYLGRQYQLKVINSDINKVKYTGRFIEIYVTERGNVKEQLQQWYREKAEIWLKKLADKHIERFKKYNAEPKKVELKRMENRWGSCSSKGRILLNPDLIKAPKACIEYVIIHELCHLVFRDHTTEFFNLQTHEMPDWQKWKMKLETLLA
ncbi:metal-dependent hydrolase [Tenacibaculum holothuriorum]|uniref:Metal-dependent hydrolase n=1 Tax=Tenacibaculum holothuriorum TaxID=1635173 RepID=A0A1Y2PB12_9FLAO|nr:SprT family zinc-dependent metalloprotease [Tenacibaculum holothuriorum]OSY87653.1 metal-dependent hydrolase [Tenacibaculum holothuriorum]